MDPDVVAPHPAPAAVAEALVACRRLWADLVDHQPGHRVHDRLAEGPGWEAYLITWPSGHGVELHDHGGSTGAVAVVEGALVELVAPRRRAGYRPRPARVDLAVGSVRRVPGHRVHDVVNVAAAPATSIHVYAPALSTMTFYDDALRPVRTERVFSPAPRLDHDVVAAALAGQGILTP